MRGPWALGWCVGPGAAALQWESIQRFGTTVLITVPSFLVRMLEHAKAHRIDPTASDVRKAICIGEPIRDITGSWNNLGARIKDQWNIELLGTYASTEMATACSERQEGSGHAVQPQLVLVEVLDEQDRPVADGAAGEVVVTPFHVSAMPLLRYRTGDICTWHKNARHGSGVGVHLGPVLGRMQHRLKVRGTTLFPAQVLDTINAMPAIPNFVVVCTTDELGGDDLEILVDLEMDEAERMREHLRGLLRVAPRVTPCPPPPSKPSSGRKTAANPTSSSIAEAPTAPPDDPPVLPFASTAVPDPIGLGPEHHGGHAHGQDPGHLDRCGLYLRSFHAAREVQRSGTAHTGVLSRVEQTLREREGEVQYLSVHQGQ
ncbi:MAG: AMP-binding protein [Flavobacteriales bacterium]|nr:AMP-binding protein [Flavobacteriales bacterium]